MVIAVDAMGGDFAPQAAVGGALASAERLPAQIVLVGRPQDIEKHLPASAQRPLVPEPLPLLPGRDLN